MFSSNLEKTIHEAIEKHVKLTTCEFTHETEIGGIEAARKEVIKSSKLLKGNIERSSSGVLKSHLQTTPCL